MSTYYDILCVPQHASEDEIRKAYRKQALLFHPDRNASPDSTARFILIMQAYEVLSNKEKRFLYDHNLGEFASGIYEMPDYETWREQKRKEQAEAEEKERRVFQAKQSAFQNHPYYAFIKTGIYLRSIAGILSGSIVLLLSLYLVWLTHLIVFFVVLPFISLGLIIAYFSFTWFQEKKKLF